MPLLSLLDSQLLAAFRRPAKLAATSAAGEVAVGGTLAATTLTTGLSRDAVAEVVAFNAELGRRSPALLQEKYARMAASPFAFFRGSDHLFYHDLERLDPQAFSQGPLTVVQGDLHLGNFGTVVRKGQPLTVGPNDFDEAFVGPALLDLQRFSASVALVCEQLGLPAERMRGVVKRFAQSYRKALEELADGHGGHGGHEPRHPKLVKKTLAHAKAQDAASLLDPIAPVTNGPRAFALGANALAVPAATRRELVAAFERTRTSLPPELARELQGYQVTDAIESIAGVGSVGRGRYRLLLTDATGKRPARLFELKQELPSAIAPYSPLSFPAKGEGRRPLIASQVFEPHSQLYLGDARLAATPGHPGGAYALRELPPQRVGLDVTEIAHEDELRDLVSFYAEKLARGHARAGEAGLSSARELLDGLPGDFDHSLESFAQGYGQQVQRDHAAFKAALEAGKLGAKP